MKDFFDIAIVGGEVSGLAAGILAAKHGAEVCIIERRAPLGMPVRCAEFVSAGFAHDLVRNGDISPKHFETQSFDHMTVHIIDAGPEKIATLPSPGITYNRPEWIAALGAQFSRVGGTVLAGETVLAISPHDKISFLGNFRIDTTHRTVRARYLIAADGPNSICARAARLSPQKKIPSLQWLIELPKKADTLHVVFHKRFKHGYAWVFPKNNMANIGIAAENATADDLSFVCTMFEKCPRILQKTGGWIPVSGTRNYVCVGDALFVGDAAGFTNPLTGAGVASAYESGEVAAQCALDRIDGKIDSFACYEGKIAHLRRACTRAAHKLETIWRENDEETFTSRVLRNWL